MENRKIKVAYMGAVKLCPGWIPDRKRASAGFRDLGYTPKGQMGVARQEERLRQEGYSRTKRISGET